MAVLVHTEVRLVGKINRIYSLLDDNIHLYYTSMGVNISPAWQICVINLRE